MKILGNGTRDQKDQVKKALNLVGQDDIDIITKIEVYNTNCVEKYCPWKSAQPKGDVTTGFAVLPDHKRHIKGNRIVLAGKNPWLAFTTLHELGHLIHGVSEVKADEYAASKL